MICRISLVFFTVLTLAACSKHEANVVRGTQDQVLFVANGEEPRELDPQLSTGSPESNIHLALYEGLTNRHPSSLEIIPGIAERWEISDDGKLYTFYLRKDARWSNGDPITAEDFVWSWQRALMPKLASEWAYMKFYIRNAEAYYNGEISDFSDVGIKAPSPYVFQVELNQATNYFLQLTAHSSYLPVHKATILKHGEMDQAISKWTNPENWVGSGPFILREWELNKVIAVEKNPQYWDAENVKLNGIHFFPITDQQAEVRAFKSGQVHLTYSPQMAIEKVGEYKRERPDVLRVTPTYASYFYEFNVTRPPLNDKRVRKALALAIDRKLLVETVTKAGEKESYSLVPNDPEGYQPKPLFQYDVEEAKRLLAEAGYPDGKGFPSIEILYNTQDNHRKVALAVQQMLAKNLGIEVTILNQEWKVYLNSKKNLEHDLARAGWIADYLDPSNFFTILSSNSGNNDTGWRNEEYDNTLAELRNTTEQEERFRLFEKLNMILSEEMPVLPVYLYADLNLVSTEVKGWHDNVMHWHPYNRVYLEASH